MVILRVLCETSASIGDASAISASKNFLYICLTKTFTMFKNLLLFFILLSSFSNAQTIVSNWSSNKKLLEINGRIASDWSTSKKLYEISSGVISEWSSSKKIYEIKGAILSDWSSGKKLLELKDGVISDWSTNKKLYEIKNGVIKDWSTNKKLYEIKGFYTSDELFLILVGLGLTP